MSNFDEKWMYCLKHGGFIFSDKNNKCCVCGSSNIRQMFEFMVIDINDKQKIEDVLIELERLGYLIDDFEPFYMDKYIYTFVNGRICGSISAIANDWSYKETTLLELKSKPSHHDLFKGAKYQSYFDNCVEFYRKNDKSNKIIDSIIKSLLFLVVVSFIMVLWVNGF